VKISILTVFPEIFTNFLETSLIKRAQENDIVSFDLIKFSDLIPPKNRIDEPVCGPGSGMIIKPEVIEKAIEQCENRHGPGYKIFFSPQGKPLTQKVLQNFAAQVQKKKLTSTKSKNIKNHLILVCTRYEGIDDRVLSYYADKIISIGDYVLMGGDIPAQVFIEGFLRLIPEVVGKPESIEKESFSGFLLDYPEYGLPKEWKNKKIPEIIFSGNHAEIEKWRKNEASKRTLVNRFDWLRAHIEKEDDIELCKKLIPNHYVALMHTDVMIKGGRNGAHPGCSSVTSLDLHDIARSCATYGIKNTFMVSPLKDQTSIMHDLLSFWKSDEGKAYNPSRHEAVSRVVTSKSLQQTVEQIEQQEDTKPIIITTSAKTHTHTKIIDYHSQGEIWKANKPVLFLFGTAQGLAEYIIEKSDFLLVSISGMTDYRHLSVRSAVGIILDRWLGLQPKSD
jgi:tRNA (guanine37-N1)-methyltransferase